MALLCRKFGFTKLTKAETKDLCDHILEPDPDRRVMDRPKFSLTSALPYETHVLNARAGPNIAFPGL